MKRFRPYTQLTMEMSSFRRTSIRLRQLMATAPLLFGHMTRMLTGGHVTRWKAAPGKLPGGCVVPCPCSGPDSLWQYVWIPPLLDGTSRTLGEGR